MNTRKYPRTLVEAFGPYASGPISEPYDKRGDGIVIVGSVLALVALAVLMYLGAV